MGRTKSSATEISGAAPCLFFICLFTVCLLPLICALLVRVETDLPLVFEQLVSFTPHIAALGVLATVVAALQRAIALAALALAGSATLLLSIAPYLPLSRYESDDIRKETNSTTELKIMQLNTLYGNREGGKIVDLIRREAPDLVFLVELDRELHAALSPLQDSYPYKIPSPGSAPEHIQLLSRHPLAEAKLLTLSDNARPVILARVEVGDSSINIIAAHLAAPISRSKLSERNRLLDELAVLAKSQTGSTVVLSDLNTTMWSPSYQRFISSSGLLNTRLGQGLLPSWFVTDPKWLQAGVSIDHHFISPELRVVRSWLGTDIGSDHLPLLSELKIINSR